MRFLSTPYHELPEKNWKMTIKDFERAAFSPINSSEAWIGTAMSPVSFFYANHLQQCVPDLKVKRVVDQMHIIHQIKMIGRKQH